SSRCSAELRPRAREEVVRQELARQELGPVGHPAYEVPDRPGGQAGRDALAAWTEGRHGVDGIVRTRMPDLKTTVTELPESRVRVEAEVPAAEVERRVQDTARRLGRDLKMPGFRKGKVPPPIVIQRVGREYVLDETVRGTLGRWYVEALDASGIHPVGEPDVDLGDLPSPGDPL